MKISVNKTNSFSQRRNNLIKAIACWLLLLTSAPLYAQNVFVSGSTGADGAFSPTSHQMLQLPESGVFNYTTVNIPAGVTITFKRNSKNTPVTILATGNVTVLGSIYIAGASGQRAGIAIGAGNFGGLGGPGGFDGGRGSSAIDPFLTGTAGQGPGGGAGGLGGSNASTGGGGGFSAVGQNASNSSGSIAGTGGQRYGSPTLLPLIGGSGGGGGGGVVPFDGGPGGGGGGAILIASSGNIIFGSTPTIDASGGSGRNGAFGAKPGAGGAGGAIRLIANTISGSVDLLVRGGAAEIIETVGSTGYIRIEAYTYTAFTPGGNTDRITFGTPTSVTAPTPPQLSITSVAGKTSPTTPTGSFNTPDLTVPNSQSNPVTVALAAANIPLSTIIRVTLTPENGAITAVSSTPLAGTVAASTATASVTLPVGTSLINATATIDLSTGISQLEPIFINGERVKRIEIAASYGGPSETFYITESGKRVKPTN